jgi:hypothetical protein
MSKKKPGAQEDELFDQMMFEGGDYDDEEMLHTFEHVTLASVEHMKVALQLTIVMKETNPNATSEDILKYFRKASETVLDCTPLKALFEKV